MGEHSNPAAGQISRITRYEEDLQEAKRILDAEEISAAAEARLQKRIARLEAYYQSDEWKQDFAEDEKGLLPGDLKRGVLSEDGIYNVLERYGEREEGIRGIREALFALRDVDYAAFQAKLIPGIDPETIVGVRTPELRALAKRLKKEEDVSAFSDRLPHAYFDENQLHAFLLSEEKSFDACIAGVERFLPFIDNWATCDQLSPPVFRKHTAELLPYIRKWIASEETYTVRFGIGMLMQHYLEEHFDPEYPAMVAAVRSGEYYVNMMIAWYFATALAKQYETVISYIEGQKLALWTHNMAIRKCVESRRISPERKEYLKTLRRKGK